MELEPLDVVGPKTFSPTRWALKDSQLSFSPHQGGAAGFLGIFPGPPARAGGFFWESFRAHVVGAEGFLIILLASGVLLKWVIGIGAWASGVRAAG